MQGAILYFTGLLWCFYGVGMVCDQFMTPDADREFHVRSFQAKERKPERGLARPRLGYIV